VVYLKIIAVEGFRGSAPRVVLQLPRRPGLTLPKDPVRGTHKMHCPWPGPTAYPPERAPRRWGNYQQNEPDHGPEEIRTL
jgi:hypothetical protein